MAGPPSHCLLVKLGHCLSVSNETTKLPLDGFFLKFNPYPANVENRVSS